MNEERRIDTNHPRVPKPDRSVLVTASLDRAQAIQTLALSTRNEINFRLRLEGQTPESVANAMPLHGDPTYHPEILETAISLEFAKPGQDASKGAVVRTLELMSTKVANTVQNGASIAHMQQRLEQGGAPRTDDTDVSPDDWERLVEGISPELRHIVEQLRANNAMYRQTLDMHDKFSDMLNCKAFERDLNASKKPGTFIFFDLINFKNFNSRYSYYFVDEVILKNLCTHLKRSLPQNAIVSIMGGDEFMIFLPDDVPGGPVDPKLATALVAQIIQDAMEGVTAESVQKAKSLLPIPKPKSISQMYKKFITLITGGENSDTEESREQKETMRIMEDIRSLHGKISAVKRTSSMQYADVLRQTGTCLKKVSAWHYRSNMRFPSCIMTERGTPSKPFSATGAEVRDFFIGMANDFKDVVARLMR